MSGQRRPCPECGVIPSYFGAMGVPWQPTGEEQCSRCTAPKHMWPSSYTNRAQVQQQWANSKPWQDAMHGKNDHCGRRPHPVCGHMCAAEADRYSAGCCRCAGRSRPCSACAADIAQAYVGARSGAAAGEMVRSVLMEDVMGNRFSISSRMADDRQKRLREGPVVTLYPQTSPEGAASILQSQSMNRGTKGCMGGGIYFAESPSATQAKAHQKGVILEARVQLGRTKQVRKGGPGVDQLTLEQVVKDGCDSVYCSDFNTGPEWVVYDRAQVVSVKRANLR